MPLVVLYENALNSVKILSIIVTEIVNVMNAEACQYSRHCIQSVVIKIINGI